MKNKVLLEIVLAALIVCLVLLPVIKLPRTFSSATVNIELFRDYEMELSVPFDTAKSDLQLPASLFAVIKSESADNNEENEVSVNSEEPEDESEIESEDESQTEQPDTENETVSVPVSWSCDDYDGKSAGVYLFTAELDTGYYYDGDAPRITVTVLEEEMVDETEPTESPEPIETELPPEPTETLEEPSLPPEATECPEPEPVVTELPLEPEETPIPEIKEISYFLGGQIDTSDSYMLIRVLAGEAGSANPVLPDELCVKLANGEYENVAVAWSSADYSGGLDGTYTFNMTLPEGYIYKGGLPFAHVIVGQDPMGQ